MRTAVFYKSISGFTATYANWIADELDADIFPAKQASVDLLQKYDLIIYGGSLHMAGIAGYKRFKKLLVKAPNRSLILFTTGASPRRENAIKEIRDNILTAEEQRHIPFYYLRGGFNFDKLDIPNKILMTLLKWKLSLTRNKSPDMKGMLHAYSHPMDFTKRHLIHEIVDHIKSMRSLEHT